MSSSTACCIDSPDDASTDPRGATLIRDGSGVAVVERAWVNAGFAEPLLGSLSVGWQPGKTVANIKIVPTHMLRRIGVFPSW